MDIYGEVDVDTERYLGCLKGVPKSVQVLLKYIEAVIDCRPLDARGPRSPELRNIPEIILCLPMQFKAFS